ncbi:MAG: LPXTG cell wall anchor domain-containing protein, partial [Streptococcus mitis]|nr:LPXTG cell wall anchor domain-containing protein [Streptococcus mitis]
VIPGADLTKTEKSVTTPNAGNDIVKPADKTVVSNPDALTPEEKKVIEDKVKVVNPGSTVVVVDDKGNTTVTTPSGKTAVIPGVDLTKTEKSVTTPNAGNDIVTPADKTVVSNPDALTPEEKKVIEDKVKAVNPGSTVVVDDKGNATVTTPSGKTAVIPGADLTKTEEDVTKPITAPSESESTLASASIDTVSSETPSESTGKSRQQLPNTGTEASKSSVLLGALAAVTGLGLFAKRRKRDDEE